MNYRANHPSMAHHDQNEIGLKYNSLCCGTYKTAAATNLMIYRNSMVNRPEADLKKLHRQHQALKSHLDEENSRSLYLYLLVN